MPLEVRFTLDEAAFTAPPAPQTSVPFDIVAADMDLDGDPDLLVNWHNLARLELFENHDGDFVLANPAGDDRSGLYENEGIPSIYAPTEQTLARARARAVGVAGAPGGAGAAGVAGVGGIAGVYVWHDPSPRQDWHFYVAPGERPVTLELRANGALTPHLDARFVRRSDEFEAELAIDTALHFQVGVAFVATQLALSASLPIFVGADLTPVGERADLWKDDPLVLGARDLLREVAEER